jgi:integrase
VFSLPKGRKSREVPLPASTRDELAAHLAKFPAIEVTLPTDAPGGKLVTARLVVTNAAGHAVHRSSFNSEHWRTARQRVGIPGTREHGQHMLRHCYASVLLDAGESIKAVSEYLGHASAAFTLKTYTHLMPSSEERTRKAVDAAWCAPSVPQTSTTQALTSN